VLAPAMPKEGKGRASKGGAAAPVAGGFTLIRVRLPLLPFVHVLYTKLHRSRKGDTALPEGRTLFVANADQTEGVLRSVFERFGEIEEIHFVHISSKGVPKHGIIEEGGEEGGRQAHVVFAEASACKAALATSEPIEVEEAPPGAMAAWIERQRGRRITPEELRLSVDAYMSHFDERTEEEKRRRADRQVDEDGFELVTYKRKARDLGGPKEPEPPRKKKKELVDFYKFQTRDKRREDLALLRKRFDNDKQRVEEMKQQRRFKPFS